MSENNAMTGSAMVPVGERGLAPRDIEGLWRVAKLLVASGLAPPKMSPAAVAYIIAAGQELGLPPVASLRSLVPIRGRVTVFGPAAWGLVRRSGLLEGYRDGFEGKTYHDDFHAWAEAKRRGDPHPMRREFSVADAKLARLWAKEGPWREYPKRMLLARAKMFLVNDLFGDILMGLYGLEEFVGTEAEEVEALPSRMQEGEEEIVSEEVVLSSPVRQQEDVPRRDDLTAALKARASRLKGDKS